MPRGCMISTIINHLLKFQKIVPAVFVILSHTVAHTLMLPRFANSSFQVFHFAYQRFAHLAVLTTFTCLSFVCKFFCHIFYAFRFQVALTRLLHSMAHGLSVYAYNCIAYLRMGTLFHTLRLYVFALSGKSLHRDRLNRVPFRTNIICL